MFLVDNVRKSGHPKTNQSTLAAKTLSLVEAAENTFLLANIIEDILSQIDKLHITCFIDSKGLYDAVNTTNITRDKQLRIEMAVVREMVDNKEIKLEWITKDYQLADILTKKELQISNSQKSLEMAKLCGSTNTKCQ